MAFLAGASFSFQLSRDASWCPCCCCCCTPLPATATPTNLGLQQRRQQKVWREKCTTSQQEMAAKLASVAEVAGRGEGQRKGRYRGVSGVAADVDGVVLVLNGVACSEQRSLSCDLTRQNSLALASSSSFSLPSPRTSLSSCSLSSRCQFNKSFAF